MNPDPALESGGLRNVEEPSTLFILWPEDERPLEEEVRLALDAAYPGLRWVDELESGGEVLWGRVCRTGDDALCEDVLVWAEERGALADGLIVEGLWDPAERAVAQKARWLIGVETLLDPAAPQRSFQAQLAFLHHACVPGLVAVYDDNAFLVRSGRQVADVAECDVDPRLSDLYAIHAVGGRGGSWLHTHGLLRIGLPEIDLVCLPGDHLREGYELIDAVADALMAGVAPESDGTFAIHDDIVLRALPLEEAMMRLPREVAGGAEQREGDQSDHGGRHLVLFDLKDDGPPLTALTRLAEDGAVYKLRSETERQSTLSRQRFGVFGQLFAMHRADSWRFHVKLAFERSSAQSVRESLWFEVLELRPGEVRGRLVNAPRDVPGIAQGDASWLGLERLTDWVIVTPDGAYSPELAPYLLAE